MIVAVTNVKGGVGKTTTAVNLAAAFAGSGLGVLLVDLDPQGSATASLGATGDGHGVAQVLLGEHPPRESVTSTSVEGLALMPSSLELLRSDLDLGEAPDRERRLKRVLAPLRRSYDLILLDTPPGLGVLTVNALVAADALVVPAQPHPLSLAGLERFFEALEALGATWRVAAATLGIALTMVDLRTRMTTELVEAIRRRYGRLVFRTEIPINVRLAEAPGAGRTIYQFERWSTGAMAYSRLGVEVLRRARRAGLL